MSHTGMNDTIPLHGSSQSDIDEIENLIHSSITSSSAAAAVAVLPARPPSPPRASIPVVSAALPPPSKPSSSAPKPSPPPPLPISTPSASSAFGSAPNTLTEPVWDTVKRDLSHIVSNLKLVVFPNPYREDPGKALRDWDLWGPFFFIVFLGLILSWSASVKKSEVFAVAFALLAAGAVILTLNVLSLMNTELDTPLKWPNSIEGQAELPRFYRHEEDRQIKLGIFEGSPLLPLLSAKPNTRSAEYFKKCVEAYDPVKDVFVFGGKGLKLCAEETATVLGLKNEGTPYIHCSTKGNCPEYYAKFLSKNEASMVGKHEFNDVLKEMVIDDSNKFDFKRIMYAYLHSFVFIVPTTRKARNCSSFLLVETQADTEAFEKVNWAKLIYERVMDDVRKLHDMRMSGKAIGTYTITSFSQVLEAWVYYRTNEKGDKYLTQSRTLTPIAFYEPVYKCAKGLTFVADKIKHRCPSCKEEEMAMDIKHGAKDPEFEKETLSITETIGKHLLQFCVETLERVASDLGLTQSSDELLPRMIEYVTCVKELENRDSWSTIEAFLDYEPKVGEHSKAVVDEVIPQNDQISMKCSQQGEHCKAVVDEVIPHFATDGEGEHSEAVVILHFGTDGEGEQHSEAEAEVVQDVVIPHVRTNEEVRLEDDVHFGTDKEVVGKKKEGQIPKSSKTKVVGERKKRRKRQVEGPTRKSSRLVSK